MFTALQETKISARRKANRRAFFVMLTTFPILLSLWGLYFKNQYIQQLRKDSEQAVMLIDRFLTRTDNLATTSIALLNKPCDQVKQELRTHVLSFLGIRSINLFKNQTIYCSSLFSTINYKFTMSQPVLELANKTRLSSDTTPRINYVKRQGEQGVVISLSVEYIINILESSSIIKSTENFQLLIGDKRFVNNNIVDKSFQKENDPFLVTLTSKHYPFSIIDSHSYMDFYQSLKSKWIDIFLLALFTSIIGLIVRQYHYKKLRKKSSVLLLQAINQRELVPFVQPIVNAHNGQWIAVEVLARLQDPKTKKYISPDIFIPIAEDSELDILMISSFMTQVAEYLVPIEDQIPEGFKISFNISARSCSDDTILHNAINFLKQFTHNKIILALEFTERDIFEINESTINLFNELKKNNIELVIDDFGTKNSNISYFNHFDINYFKIDPSFTSKIETSPLTRTLINNMLDLATRLAIPVVVEGIETKAQKNYYLDRGIYQQQGYLFAKPMSLDEFQQYFLKKS